MARAGGGADVGRPFPLVFHSRDLLHAARIDLQQQQLAAGNQGERPASFQGAANHCAERATVFGPRAVFFARARRQRS